MNLTDEERWLERQSAATVRLLQPFRDWLEEIAENDPFSRTAEQLLASEPPIVWVIRSTGTFKSEAHFQDYMDSLKPGMMRSELRSFCKDEDLWPTISIGSFDTHFELLVYDYIASAANIEPGS